MSPELEKKLAEMRKKKPLDPAIKYTDDGIIVYDEDGKVTVDTAKDRRDAKRSRK